MNKCFFHAYTLSDTKITLLFVIRKYFNFIYENISIKLIKVKIIKYFFKCLVV